MGKSPTSTDYLQEFTVRVYSARKHARRTQDDIAHALQITQTAYSKYEGRSIMPSRYVRTFCMVCQVSAEWLVTGQGDGPPLLAKPPPAKRRGRRKRRPEAA